MIPYLDASALVKRYVQEPGSEEVSRLIARARVVGTSAITRVEVTAALARAGGSVPCRLRRPGRRSPRFRGNGRAWCVWS
jgi:predicted nucleic acid-binding protein